MVGGQMDVGLIFDGLAIDRLMTDGLTVSCFDIIMGCFNIFRIKRRDSW